ncbi:unnamed protein product [Amoebophrya sp. A25]|nr:unnamed protein product [Amoebophrya sp. A25]|eukprot:GSA25T00014868001.1
MENVVSEYEADKLKERLAKLQGGVGVIRVGGASEVEVQEVRDRITDALCATRCALEEGVVPGGGAALLYSINTALADSNVRKSLGVGGAEDGSETSSDGSSATSSSSTPPSDDNSADGDEAKTEASSKAVLADKSTSIIGLADKSARPQNSRSSKEVQYLSATDADRLYGVEIVRKALRKPCQQLVENAGKDGSLVAEKLIEAGDARRGYDASRDRFVDMFEAGIIDPTKVVRTALVDASSVAGLLTTTEVVVTEVPIDGRKPSPMDERGAAQGMGSWD